ncbi:exonuclease domain-containing protein [Spongiimicrobium salis]|uniref:exonuclease domain-containing protein n=1 Tax=Spongiimicrobium salis TaxID=1667022 RepID=UPI00374D3AB8
MNYIILDLEATCWKEKSIAKQSEIIEIGALKIDASGKSMGEFNAFVKPKLNPFLSDFCKALTSITQLQVDHASSFPMVCSDFLRWIGTKEEYLLCSWGFYDKKQFQSDCKLHTLDANWTHAHISLKHQYAKMNNLRRPLGMGGALQREQLTLEGTHHRDIDDARNISKIFMKYLGKWSY